MKTLLTLLTLVFSLNVNADYKDEFVELPQIKIIRSLSCEFSLIDNGKLLKATGHLVDVVVPSRFYDEDKSTENRTDISLEIKDKKLSLTSFTEREDEDPELQRDSGPSSNEWDGLSFSYNAQTEYSVFLKSKVEQVGAKQRIYEVAIAKGNPETEVVGLFQGQAVCTTK